MELILTEKDLQDIAVAVVERIKENFVIPAPTAPPDGLLGVKGAADYLGASESFLNRLTAQRKVPVVKLGSANRFRRTDLDKWITKNTVKTVL